MAKFAAKGDNFCLLSHTTSSKNLAFNNPIWLKPRPYRFSLSNRCLSCRVWCSIKEESQVKDTEEFDGVLTGLRVDDADQSSSEGKLAHVSNIGELGSFWENIPERYKLIGTTSLAFVICNMDKVAISFEFLSICVFEF